MTTAKVKASPRFVELANLLLQIMIEGQEFDLPADFKMPEEVIAKTAVQLQMGYERGDYQLTNGGLYYSGMTEDFGGFYEAVFHDLFQEDSVTVFKKKLEAFAKAAEELDNAWDSVDGDPEVTKALSIRWPFLERLYYLALRDTKNWAKDTAAKLK